MLIPALFRPTKELLTKFVVATSMQSELPTSILLLCWLLSSKTWRACTGKPLSRKTVLFLNLGWHPNKKFVFFFQLLHLHVWDMRWCIRTKSWATGYSFLFSDFEKFETLIRVQWWPTAPSKEASDLLLRSNVCTAAKPSWVIFFIFSKLSIQHSCI